MRLGKSVVVSFIGSLVVCSLASAPVKAEGEPPSRQWALTGQSSDEYSEDYVAQNAAGAPDSNGCDDDGLWATDESDAIASIVLGYDNPVIPGEINVYQNSVQGAISLIEVSADGTVWTTVYTGDPSLARDGTCLEENHYDDILSAPVTGVDSQISFVRITVDQTTDGWAEIDAVELVEATLPEAPTTPPTTPLVSETLPATGNSSSSTLVLSLMLILSGSFVVVGLRRRSN